MPENIKVLVYNLLPFAAILVFFYFALIKPQKKKEQKMQDMRNSIKPGDKIITIGGIVGRVANIKEDSIVIESTGDNSKIEIMKWGINSVVGGKDEND